VAAEASGLPQAAVIVSAAGGLGDLELVGPPLAELRHDHCLAADPECLMLHRYLTPVPAPPSFRHPAHPLPITAHHIRPAALDPSVGASGEEVTHRFEDLPIRPTLYVTLGTIFNQESGELFTRILEGLSAFPSMSS
jgi:UDP:flavonoid glycosyltransferase YjiC (YdhE family)